MFRWSSRGGRLGWRKQIRDAAANQASSHLLQRHGGLISRSDFELLGDRGTYLDELTDYGHLDKTYVVSGVEEPWRPWAFDMESPSVRHLAGRCAHEVSSQALGAVGDTVFAALWSAVSSAVPTLPVFVHLTTRAGLFGPREGTLEGSYVQLENFEVNLSSVR